MLGPVPAENGRPEDTSRIEYASTIQLAAHDAGENSAAINKCPRWHCPMAIGNDHGDGKDKTDTIFSVRYASQSELTPILPFACCSCHATRRRAAQNNREGVSLELTPDSSSLAFYGLLQIFCDTWLSLLY